MQQPHKDNDDSGGVQHELYHEQPHELYHEWLLRKAKEERKNSEYDWMDW